MMQATWSSYTLNFKLPAGTSRGVMHTRPVWYLFLTRNQVTGMGECAPLAGLSLDDISRIESKLDEVCQQPQHFLENRSLLAQYPAIRCALEMAFLDLTNSGKGLYFHSPLENAESVKINGLIWMGDKDDMLAQIREKLETGWRCIKIKIGGLDFASELAILKSIRQQFSAACLELRLDANGAFTAANVLSRLDQLASFFPHSIEQPIATGQFECLARLCEQSPIPIALDEELIPLITKAAREHMLDRVKPHYLVLKPSLLGGFSESDQWIALAKQRGIGYWITSALESSIGLQAISQWTSKQNLTAYQGLGTGQLFINNLASPLCVQSGELHQRSDPVWQDVHQFYAQWLQPSQVVTLQTSGSTGKPKLIHMDKSVMRASARLTAKTFALKTGDVALLCLPVNYIAGKMMLVRAIALSLDLLVVEPSSLSLKSLKKPITFAAMTAMQLEKLLEEPGEEERHICQQLNLIETLIIGGAPLGFHLQKKLRLMTLSTRIYETYGMTETASHVAIRPVNGDEVSDYFHALEGVSFSQDQRGCLLVKARHLGGRTLVTNDLIDLGSAHTFKWLGRVDGIINSGGIKIMPEAVEAKLASSLAGFCFYIRGEPDEKLGEQVVLVIEGEPVQLDDAPFHLLNPYERPRKIVFVNRFQRTESGKVIRV